MRVAGAGRGHAAWYLLKAGDREEGEAVFARLRAERTGDPEIVSTLANARMDAGDGQGALEAYNEALDLAKQVSDHGWIDRLRGERQYCRYENGLPPDEDDRLPIGVAPCFLRRRTARLPGSQGTRSSPRSHAGLCWLTIWTIRTPIIG
jgi:hypothetical protein